MAGKPKIQGEVTRLLRSVSKGSSKDFDKLFQLIYEKLRQIARAHLRGSNHNKTISTTDLVHEAYLKMRVSQFAGINWDGRAHFYAIASRAMRQILVDYARYKNAAKRTPPNEKLTLSGNDLTYEINMPEILALNQAMDTLAKRNERLCRVVEYRFFGGMSEEEIAQALDVTKRTVHRDWVKARLFLHEELYPETENTELH
jgi:RNA polymerase sigma factor (TIGR02999 family)